MSGLIARRGFSYQDYYLLLSVLEALGEEFSANWDRFENYKPPKFGIEAPSREETDWQREEQLLDWDVLVRHDEGCRLIEVKSGAIAKSDRRHLWLRLRRELSRASREEIAPGLVVDPDKVANIEIWRGLVPAVRASTGMVPISPPDRVTTSQHLVDEALWFLCSADASIPLPLCAPEEAIASLSRFRLQEYRRDELNRIVSAYIGRLFPDGIMETIQRQLMAWITERAEEETPELHFFTAAQLVREVKILERSISADKGAIKRWSNVWDSLPELVLARSSCRIGNTGISIPKEESQPAAVAAMVNEDANTVILAAAGVGKSALLAQLVEEEHRTHRFALWCSAADLAAALSPREFADSVRFQADLETLRNPNSQCRLYVDGLDEIDPSIRNQLAIELQLLGTASNLRVTLSVRDSIWEGSGLRHALRGWKDVVLQQWSEQTVTKLFEGRDLATEIGGNLLTLLRTPILLDLFWRTFLESEIPVDRGTLSRIQTRHGILAAFWKVRLLNSPRADCVSAQQCIDSLTAVCVSCAISLGAFRVSEARSSALTFLRSESVLIEEAGLQRRYRFRHPLFRDFALSQWCLAAQTEEQIVERWRSIRGSIQRIGCLRSMIEAFADPGASTELPGLTLTAFLCHVVVDGEEWGKAIARCLGMLAVDAKLNPAGWRENIRSLLPPGFGSEIFVSAQSSSNPSWGIALSGWPDTEPWYGNDFLERLLHYGNVMQRIASKGEPHSAFRSSEVAVARKLRHLSEEPQYAYTFAQNSGWLKAATIRFVARAEATSDTLMWLNRDVPALTWRTRTAAMEVLPLLAAADPVEAGATYRQLLGLKRIDETAVVNKDWFQEAEYASLDLSLINTEPSSLLARYPMIFVGVAIDLAEALWGIEREEHRASIEAMSRLLPEIGERAGADDPPSTTHGGIGDLVDDNPLLGYWNNPYRLAEANGKVLDALAQCLEATYQSNRDQCLTSIVPLFAASRLATVHAIVFDFCLRHSTDLAMIPVLKKEVSDPRLYHVLDLWYWIEQSVVNLWPDASDELRATVIANIDSPELGEYRAQLLCRIPKSFLTESQRALVDGYRRQGFGAPMPHPEAEGVSQGLPSESEWTAVDPEDNWERWMGSWPDSIDINELKKFHRKTQNLQSNDLNDDDIAEVLPAAVASAENILQMLLSEPALITAPRHQWVLGRLNSILNRTMSLNPRRAQPVVTFSGTFVRSCGNVAWIGLSANTSDLKMQRADGDVISQPGHVWDASVSLLNSAMMLPPLRDNAEDQERFDDWLTQTMRSGSYVFQQILAVEISAYHWFRSSERRALLEQLFWVETKHGAPIRWALRLIRFYSAQEQERICRLLLSRDDIEGGESLAKALGEKIGVWGLTLRNDRRLPIAALAREVVEQSSSFPLLRRELVCISFLSSFVFGMKNAAQSFADRAELAVDYGDWCLRIWCRVRQQESSQTTRGIILFALRWLGRGIERTSTGLAILRRWCGSLQPLLQEIVETGAAGDISALFEMLHEGLYVDVLEVDYLFDLVDRFCSRSTNQVVQSGTFRGKWIEAANYAAESLQALQENGLLPELTVRNKAYNLLTKLADSSVGSSKAATILLRLQVADE